MQIEKYVIDEKTAGVAPGRFDLKYMLRINVWGAFQFGLREEYKRLLLGIRWDQNIDILNGKHPAMCSGGCARKDSQMISTAHNCCTTSASFREINADKSWANLRSGVQANHV